MNKPGLAKTLPAIDLDAAALEIATAIHTAYRDSYWAQNAVMTRVREELERLDREYQEMQAVGVQAEQR